MDLHKIPEIILAIFIFYVLFNYLFKREKMSWILPTLNSNDSLLWVILNLHRIHDALQDLLRRKNGTHILIGKWLGCTDYLLTVDPTNIHYITTTNFQNYPKDEECHKIFDVLGYGLFNSEGEDWRHYRRIVHAVLKNRDDVNYSNKTAHATLERVLVPLLKYVSDQNDDCVLDIQDVFQRFTFDFVFKTLTGYDTGSLAIDFPKVPFLDALADFEEGVLYRFTLPEVLWKLQLLLGVGPENKLGHARKVIRRYISDIVIRKRRDVITRYGKVNEDDGECGADVLTIFIKELMKDDATDNCISNTNNEEFLEDIALQYIIAGRDTVSSAMTWFIWLMTTHPRVEQKIRDELREIIPDAKIEKHRVFNYDETNKLVYLHATLYESLRLYPPVPLQYKTLKEPDVLPSGHQLLYPKMKIIIPIYAMARMKSLWGDNCSDFEPERWITDRGTIKHEPPSKFLVFFAGPRSCLGKEAAMTQMKMIAATLLHNFRFELVEGQDIKPDVSMILNMNHGLNVKVYNRWA